MKRMKYLKYALLLVLTLFLAGCPPYLVNILTPSDGAEFESGEEIKFTGSAMDFIDGKLEGYFLVWTSNIDGEIGTRTEFSSDDLSDGTHVITLIASNSQGLKGIDTITITISEGVVTTTTTTIEGTTTTTGGEDFNITMIDIPGGTFEMGCSPAYMCPGASSGPRHTVTISAFKKSLTRFFKLASFKRTLNHNNAVIKSLLLMQYIVR